MYEDNHVPPPDENPLENSLLNLLSNGDDDNNAEAIELELPLQEKSSDEIMSDSVTHGENSDVIDTETSDHDNNANQTHSAPPVQIDIPPSEPLLLPPSIVTEHHEPKKKKKPVSEGKNFTGKICVGSNHQIPFTPSFFLEDSHKDVKYDLARLVYSPYMMEKFKRKRLTEGRFDSTIKSEYEMAEFIQHVAKSWKTYQVWHPFSPEFAYKILHYAEYDPHKAIKLMSDPHFNFNMICDPPTRKYDNKWKPRDRRGQIPSHPYPSPVTLRSYLSRRQMSSYAR